MHFKLYWFWKLQIKRVWKKIYQQIAKWELLPVHWTQIMCYLQAEKVCASFFAICQVTKNGPAVFASPQSCDNHLGHVSRKAPNKAAPCEHCVASHHVEEMYRPWSAPKMGSTNGVHITWHPNLHNAQSRRFRGAGLLQKGIMLAALGFRSRSYHKQIAPQFVCKQTTITSSRRSWPDCFHPHSS